MKNYYKFAILLLTSIFISAACAPVKSGRESTDQKLAESVVERFHELYNEQNYEEIYNQAHEDAKQKKTKEALGLALAERFGELGRFVSSELVYTKVQPVAGNERQVEFVYLSKFEKGTRNETFLIVTDDRKGALHSIGELTDEELNKLKSE